MQRDNYSFLNIAFDAQYQRSRRGELFLQNPWFNLSTVASVETTDQVSVPRQSSMWNLVKQHVCLSDEGFQEKVDAKINKSPMEIREAEIEVFLDECIQKTGSKEDALLLILSKQIDEKKVHRLVTSLLHRGANPTATDKDRCSALYHAVFNQYKSVCAKLLEHEALPDVRALTSFKLPYKLAYDNDNDDIAAMLIRSMKKELVRKIHLAENDLRSEFSFHKLLQKNMPNTIQAVLDCMMEEKECKTHAYYDVLETDATGFPPDSKHFKSNSDSGFHIIAKQGNKNIVNHDVVRLLVRCKWKKFAKRRFLLNSFLNVVTLISITYSAVVASKSKDPLVYGRSGEQIFRAICEVFSCVMTMFTLVTEINQIRRHRLEYWKYPSNWIDLLSSTLLLILVPIRFTGRNEQWFVFSAAYLLWTVRVLKFTAVFRQTGAYILMLWQIFIHDIVQFALFFVFILLAFGGCLLLSLRGEDSLEKFTESSSFWYILFVGVRILIEAERIVDYTEFQTTSVIIMVVFLFIVCVLMLNILIAQVSDTYKNVKEDVHRGFEVNRASIVSRVEFNSLFNRKNNRRGNYKPYESFDDVSKVLEKWECSPLNKMNKNLQEIWNGIGSHELNIRTVQNRLSRMESCLSDIQKNLKKLN